MTRPPRIALALLERFVPDSEPLAGDLVETFERRASRIWFWWQVLAAIASVRCVRSGEIRPLRLVALQPADAIERTRRLTARHPPVTLSASPIGHAGALGLAIFWGLLTIVAPQAWGLLLLAALLGSTAGLIAVLFHTEPLRPTTLRLR